MKSKIEELQCHIERLEHDLNEEKSRNKEFDVENDSLKQEVIQLHKKFESMKSDNEEVMIHV